MCVKVEKPDEATLAALGFFSWPTWSKEVSTFPWSYNTQEIAYILEGEVMHAKQWRRRSKLRFW